MTNESVVHRATRILPRPHLDRSNQRSDDDEATTGRAIFKRLAWFVVLAFGWSWGCWLLAPVARGQSWGGAAGLASGLMFLGGFGTSLAAVGLVGQAGGWAGLRNWVARGLRWRGGWGWAAVAVGLPLGVMALAAAVHVGLGGILPPSPVRGHGLVAAANFGLILVLGGPLGEEFGWRGYALPVLQERYGWRVGSLVLGVVWSGWHLPLFFLSNTSQQHIPIALFLVSTTALSVLFAGLAQRTAGSLVLAILFHTAVNYWSWVVPILPTSGRLRPFDLATGLLVLLALALLARRKQPFTLPQTPPPA